MLHFISAFLTEAKPIIAEYGLKELKPSGLFRVFSNDTISMTLSGMGKLASAQAMIYTHELLECKKGDAWVNVGIAGHGNANKGELLLAHSILDAGSGEKWYPQFIFTPPCGTVECITLEKPSDDYQDCLFDMEASGFYSAAMRCTNLELSHCLKVVSDNKEQSYKKLDKREAETLISKQVPVIKQIVNELLALSTEYQTSLEKPTDFAAICNTCHFTESEKVILEKLLRRWQVLQPDSNASDMAAELPNSKAILKALKQHLDTQDFSYD